MRLAPYLRRSREKDNGYGLDAQDATIRSWAEYRRARGENLELSETYRDDDVSGATPPDKRPALAPLLERLRARELDGLIVARFDRLSRSVYDFAGLLRRARDEGWRVVCLDPELDTSTPAGKAMAHMFATFAEFERDLFVERIQAARRAKMEAGGYGGGRVPYAMRLTEEGTLEPEPEAVELATMIRHARERGLSFAATARELNEAGVPTPTGSRWHAETVRRVLKAAERGT